MSRNRYGTAHRVDRNRRRKRSTLQDAIEVVPSHPTTTPTSARQPALPDPGGCVTKSSQRHRVAGDPVVRKVAHQFLTQGPRLVLYRLVAVGPTPFRQGFQSTAEAAPGPLALHHPLPLPGACPVIREAPPVKGPLC